MNKYQGLYLFLITFAGLSAHAASVDVDPTVAKALVEQALLENAEQPEE